MDLRNRTEFTDVDIALEEAQFLVGKDKVPYCIIRAWSKNKHGYKLYVVPADSVVEIQILETFNPG
jgi:hypothetical protein